MNLSKDNNQTKYAFQYKLANLLRKLSRASKWNELEMGLKYMNSILTRHYMNIYWKVKHFHFSFSSLII
jgi:hypothetical protein